MAIRVRKLAKELDCSPAEVLGLLHAIGIERYRSAEDQVPDLMVRRVRTALRAGVKPMPFALTEVARPAAPSPKPATDVMGQLVPGVRRADAPRPAGRVAAPIAPKKPPPQDDRSHVAAGTVEAQRAAMAELDATRLLLAAERNALDAAREALRAEGERLRSELAVQMSSSATSLGAVLESRGIAGHAEQERLLGALAAAQRLRALIPYLKVTDVAAAAQLLEEPVARPLPHPSVPADLDAELPVGADTRLARIGERAMLLGLRRMVIVGGDPRLHKFFRDSFDPRIDVRFRPAGTRPRTQADAEVDVTRSDVVILWAVEPDAEAQRVYQTSRAVVVEVVGSTLSDLLNAAHRRLDDV